MDILSSYNPTNIKYISSIKKKEKNGNSGKKIAKENECGNINMWYKIKKGYEQIKEYERKNNIKYDFYIRCRYDILIDSYDIDFNTLKKDTLYFGSHSYSGLFFRFFFSDFAYSLAESAPDEFFISGRHNMDIYCYLYDLLIFSNNRCIERSASENQFWRLIKFNYTDTKIINIKYKWVCFSEMECFKYHYTKLPDRKRGLLLQAINMRIPILYIIIILIIFITIKRILK